MSLIFSSKRPFYTKIPPFAARLLRQIGIRARYVTQCHASRRGFRQYSDQYPQKILFIAGLPKSGTTWLERMMSSYPGFHNILIPEAVAYELRTGGSHDYDLPEDMFNRFQNMLVLTKMHVHGSPHNVRLLHESGVRYVVLYRDLRDVAVSHFFYVRQTPWHPEYRIYAGRKLPDALILFANRTLVAFEAWIQSWEQNRDPEMSLVIRYEDMIADTSRILAKVARHFALDDSPEMIQDIVNHHTFQKLSGGRIQGKSDQNSFYRKGIVGDWRNHFTPEVKEIYKRLIGDFLIAFAYEKNDSW